MSDEGPTGKVVEIAKTVFELASESPELTDAGRTRAKSARTIAKAVDNALLPIAAMNYGFERARAYFEERFRTDMEEVTKEIPPDEIVEPKPSVAGPALSGLACTSLSGREQRDVVLRRSARGKALSRRIMPVAVLSTGARCTAHPPGGNPETAIDLLFSLK